MSLLCKQLARACYLVTSLPLSNLQSFGLTFMLPSIAMYSPLLLAVIVTNTFKLPVFCTLTDSCTWICGMCLMLWAFTLWYGLLMKDVCLRSSSCWSRFINMLCNCDYMLCLIPDNVCDWKENKSFHSFVAIVTVQQSLWTFAKMYSCLKFVWLSHVDLCRLLCGPPVSFISRPTASHRLKTNYLAVTYTLMHI